MPALSDIIRRVTLMFSAPGADQTAQQLNNVATAEDRVSASSSTMSRATLSAQSALDRLQRSVDTEYRSQQSLASATSVLSRARGQGLIDASREAELLELAKQKYGGLIPEVEHTTEAFALNRMQMMELTHVGRSFFDVMASGGSPMRALELEATRIAQVFSEGNGGVGGTFKALGSIVGQVLVKFWPLTAAVAAVGIGFAGLTTELDKTTGKNITFMETIKAVAQTIWKDFTSLIGPAVKQVGGWFGQLIDFITPGVKMAVNFIVGGFVGAFNGIKDTWSILPAAMGDIVIQAANSVVTGTQNLINGAIGQINNFIAMVNDKLGPLGVKLGSIGQVSLGNGIANPFAGSAAKAGSMIGADMQSAMSTDYAGKFYGQVQDFALKDYQADQLKKMSKAAKEAAKQFADLLTTGKDDTSSLQAQAASLGKTAEQTAFLEEQTKLLNKARQDGLTLSSSQLAQIDKEATAYAKAKEALAELTQVYDLGKSSFEDFFSTLKSGFQNGETAIQAFGDAAGKVLDDLANKALQMAADGIWNSIFGALGGGSGGGLLGSLLHLGGSSTVGAGLGIAGAVLHDGGIAGADGYSSGRMFPASTWSNAPRYHLGIDEVPAILQRGERVIPANQNMGAANGNGGTVINNYIDAKGGEIGVEAKIAKAQTDFSRNELARRLNEVNANPYRRGFRQGGVSS
jgi:hypothetical protein